MFYRRDIEDKKRPPPMRSFSPDGIVSFEAAEIPKKSSTIMFVGAILFMLVVVVGFVVALTLYYTAQPERAEEPGRAERRIADQMKAVQSAEALEASRPKSAPEVYDLLVESKMLEAYVNASGGRNVLFALETMQFTGRITRLGQEQTFELTKQSSNLMRLTLEDDGSETSYSFDGQSFWQASNAQGAEGEKGYSLLGAVEQERFFECRRFFEPLLAYALRGEGTLQVIEFGEWLGRTAVRVQLRGSSSNRIDAFLDPKTLRVRGLVERVRSSGDERTVAMSDFRDVDGVYIPFNRRVSIRGELVYEMKIDSCRTNLNLAPSFFTLPKE
jgi:hypothetical protein